MGKKLRLTMGRHFGEVREVVQRACMSREHIGDVVYMLLTLGKEREVWVEPYAHDVLSRTSYGACTAWDVVEFCVAGEPCLQARVTRDVWGRSLREAKRDVRHFTASVAWALAMDFDEANVTSSVRNTGVLLSCRWSKGGAARVTTRNSARWVKRYRGWSAGQAFEWAQLPDHVYRLFS